MSARKTSGLKQDMEKNSLGSITENHIPEDTDAHPNISTNECIQPEALQEFMEPSGQANGEAQFARIVKDFKDVANTLLVELKRNNSQMEPFKACLNDLHMKADKTSALLQDTRKQISNLGTEFSKFEHENAANHTDGEELSLIDELAGLKQDAIGAREYVRALVMVRDNHLT